MYRMKMNLTQDQLGKKLNTKKLQFRITKLDIELLNKTIYSKLHIFLNVSIDDLFPQRKKSNDITTVYNQLTPPRQHNVLELCKSSIRITELH